MQMKEQVAIQNLLQEKFMEIQRGNPRYSLRAYARRVGVHVGALTYIINGKRNVSKKLAERITTKLLIEPQLRSEILALFPDKIKYRKTIRAGRDPEARETTGTRYLELNAMQFKIAAEWEHFAVLSLVNCADFEGSCEWISKRLAIPPTKARRVVERLLDLGLLTRSGDGTLSRSKVSYQTSDEVAEISVKKHHEQSLDLAKESLFRDDVKIRDFTTLTMAIDPSRLKAAKDRIRGFEDELSDLLESGNREEVYRLSVQLFPLSRIESDKGVNK
jgi:uncharacterized protein (TIGR02147 family)